MGRLAAPSKCASLEPESGEAEDSLQHQVISRVYQPFCSGLCISYLSRNFNRLLDKSNVRGKGLFGLRLGGYHS